MAFTFDAIFAADPNNAANVASNAAITIFDPNDPGKAPITITDPTDSPISNPITVNKNGFGPAFKHATLDRVGWSGGGFEGFFTSYEGIKNVALEAQAAAEAAGATAAAEAAAGVAPVVAEAEQAAADAAAAQAAAAASATAAANSAALVNAPADSAIAAAINGSATETKAALSATYAPKKGGDYVGYVAAPTGVAATDAANVLSELTAANTAGGGTVILRSGTYELSTAHTLIPAKVSLRGSGASTVLNGGAFAIVNDGLLADVQIGTGWTLFSDFLSGHWGSAKSGVAVIGGSVSNVTSARGGTEIWPSRQTHNMLPRTIARLRKNLTFKKTNIVIMSDSLGTDGSGSGIGWAQLLFDDTYKAAEGAAYNVGNIFGGNNTAVTKLTIPGSTPEIDLAYVSYEHKALSAGDGLDDQVKMTEGYATYPPSALANADLAIICQGHNGGTTSTVENIVANLRARGTEVIIVTQNPSGTNDPNYARSLWAYREIAAAYGCAIADTYSVFLREIYAGRSTANALVADGTHPNQAGWNLYAQTIRDVLLDQRDGAPSAGRSLVSRLITNNTNTTSTEAWGNVAGAQFTPISQSAGVTFTTPTDTTRSPLTGRRGSLTNTLALVPNGEYVEFAASEAYDVTVIFEQGSATASAAIRSNAGATTLRTFTVGTTTGTLASTTVDSGTWGAAALTTRPIRIYSTAGTLRVIGVVWTTVGRRYQPKNADGSFKGVTLSGTWAVQAGPWYGVSNIPVTDTTGSYAEWEFIGDGFWLKTVKSPSGGVLRVTVDGVTESGVVDTYSTTEKIYMLSRTGLGYGRHKVRIAYEFNNGSVAAAGGATRGARRLALYEIAATDSRMNANQAELSRPADVI